MDAWSVLFLSFILFAATARSMPTSTALSYLDARSVVFLFLTQFVVATSSMPTGTTEPVTTLNPLVPGPNAYVAPPCVAVDTSVTVLYTPSGTPFLRTPEERFASLAEAGWPYEPRYALIDGLRMHYIDQGPHASDEVLLMLHGLPTWSYLYHRMVPILVSHGLRVLCVDYIGMGRSDKPIALELHSYGLQVARMKAFIQAVLPEESAAGRISIFVQDWGSLIGLRLVGDHPAWFRRVIAANGDLPVVREGYGAPYHIQEAYHVNINCSEVRPFSAMRLLGEDRMAQAKCGATNDEYVDCIKEWARYALTSPSWKATDMIQLRTAIALSSEQLAAYEAPYPSFIYKTALRAFTSMMGNMAEPEFGNLAAHAQLERYRGPWLALGGNLDPAFGTFSSEDQIAKIPGAQGHGYNRPEFMKAPVDHFIQEDVGEPMAEHVAAFIAGTSAVPPAEILLPKLTDNAWVPAWVPLLATYSNAAIKAVPIVTLIIIAGIVSVALRAHRKASPDQHLPHAPSNDSGYELH